MKWYLIPQKYLSTNNKKMEKFTKFQKANLKRYAQIMDPLISKRNRVAAKIAELQKEVDGYQEQIDMTDALVKNMTGGYSIESIVRKVITPTDKLDKNGNVIKLTTFEFIYPETIVPTVKEDTETYEEVEVESASDVADLFPEVKE